MAFFDEAVDTLSPWLYDLFKSAPETRAAPAITTVPNSPMANALDQLPQSPQITTPTGILGTVQQQQVPNSPMANAVDQVPKEPSADETLQGLLATMGGETGAPDDDRTTNRRIAMLGLGLKAAGELMQQQMNGHYMSPAQLPGRGVPSGAADMHALLEKRRQANLHPVDWSRLSGQRLR